MGASLIAVCFLILMTVFLSQPSYSMNTIIVDGFASWKSPTMFVGDSVVLKHNHLQNLYLFHNRKAFELCILAQASLIYKGKSNQFMWHPTSPGFYYFSIKQKSNKSCEKGEKVSVRVITPQPSPGFSPLPAPPPTSGGDLPSFPSHGWVSRYPSSLSPARPPSPAPTSGSPEPRGIPFISSNPAVPIPTGETDTATIRPLSTPGDESQVVGFGSSLRAPMALLAFVMMSGALHLWHVN